ncbi:cytosolic non-specific dipeptidase-like isoform X2 [Dermacentor andersoni]|uniref:cytosolic non-specific dipeptidase-like isoform X2 n=1 Tax=Dermacentor andersoni TaxID=34620 RepID=UPI002417A3EC|nr:cytosolic non-specific dipeptidase-like isoform X2 [Dermacentor andersoni]
MAPNSMPEELGKIFSVIDENRDAMLQSLKELVAIPSVSADSAHRDDIVKAMHMVKKMMEAEGVRVDMQPLGDQTLSDGTTLPFPPLLLGSHGDDANKKTVCMYAHLDVQPAKMFMYEGMEEVGSQGTVPYLRSDGKSKFFDGIDFVCISDNFWLGTEKPCLTYGLRGITYFDIEVVAGTRDFHSGQHGGITHEAMSDLMDLFDSLMDATGKIAVPGIYDDVRPVTDHERELYRRIDFSLNEYRWEMGVSRLAHEDKVETLVHRWREPCLSLHGISGAYPDPGEPQLVPTHVHGKFSIRTVPDQQPDKVKECVTKHLEQRFAQRNSPNRLKVTMTHSTSTWFTDPMTPHFKAAAAAVKHVHGVEPDLTCEGGTIGTVSALQDHVCRNTLLMPINTAGSAAHAQNENTRLWNYINGAKQFAAYWYEVAKLH